MTPRFSEESLGRLDMLDDLRGDDEIGIPRDAEAVELWKNAFAGVGIEAQIFAGAGSDQNASSYSSYC